MVSSFSKLFQIQSNLKISCYLFGRYQGLISTLAFKHAHQGHIQSFKYLSSRNPPFKRMSINFRFAKQYLEIGWKIIFHHFPCSSFQEKMRKVVDTKTAAIAWKIIKSSTKINRNVLLTKLFVFQYKYVNLHRSPNNYFCHFFISFSLLIRFDCFSTRSDRAEQLKFMILGSAVCA